jgi:hypothetical protein
MVLIPLILYIFNPTPFIRTLIFPVLSSINLMASIPRVGSLKCSIIFLYMALLMSWPNFTMLFSIWIMYFGNGANGVKNSCQGYIAWTQFVVELYERFDNDTHYLIRLTKLKQLGTVEDFITSFGNLGFRIEGMSYAFF